MRASSTGSSCQLMLDILEQRGCYLHQVLPIWRTDFHAVVISGLNSKERETGNRLKRAHVATRFLQPIHQGGEVVSEGSLPALGVDPAFQGLFASLLQPESDAAIGNRREPTCAAPLQDQPGRSAGSAGRPDQAFNRMPS
jgi:hypothetical protein